MELDLIKRRAIRTAERLLPGADLKAVLADPFIMEIVGASSARLGPHTWGFIEVLGHIWGVAKGLLRVPG